MESRSVVSGSGLVHLSSKVRIEGDREKLDEETGGGNFNSLEVDLLGGVVDEILLQKVKGKSRVSEGCSVSTRCTERRTPGMGIPSGMEAKLEGRR